MSHQSKLIASDILGYLDQHQRKVGEGLIEDRLNRLWKILCVIEERGTDDDPWHENVQMRTRFQPITCL